jgi:hypothetical protein
MLKSFFLLPPRADISREKFHSHWIDPHGTLAAEIGLLRGYVQSHRLADDILDVDGSAPWEGIAEIWLVSLDDVVALPNDPDMITAVEDQPNFMNLDGIGWITTREEVLIDGAVVGWDSNGVKVLHLVRRAAGTTPAQFREMWHGREDDVELSKRLGASRHVRSAALAELDEAPEQPTFDGVREVWWPRLGDLWRARADQGEAWNALFGGPAIDPAPSRFFVAGEYRVK